MMSPSGWRHGEVVGNLHGLLWRHVREKRLGKLFGAETGFLIGRDPDTVRAPDIAFVSRDNLPERDPSDAYWPGAPDLVVEVLSPHDKTGEVDEKIECWLDAGVRLLWVVDPKLRHVTCYRSVTDVMIQTTTDQLDGGDIVPGFHCPVADIFSANE